MEKQGNPFVEWMIVLGFSYRRGPMRLPFDCLLLMYIRVDSYITNDLELFFDVVWGGS